MSTDTIEEARRVNYETWETIAPTWADRREQVEAVAAPVREWVLRELDPQPGDTLLELAAGVGITGFEAARLIGDEGKLIASDFSPAMLEQTKQAGAEFGVDNADYRVIDAEQIDLDDDSVDGVICRFAYMLMPDPDAALAETRRVLRPGGRLALTVWGPPERNPFFVTLMMAMVGAGHLPPPDPDGPGLFRMASEEATRGMLEQAGFDSVRVEETPVRFPVPGIDEYLEFALDTAGPVAMALRSLSPEDVEALKPQLEEGLARFSSDDGYDLPGVALNAVAS